MRERLKSNLSNNVVTHLFAPSIETEQYRSFESMMEVNKAHLVMLISEGIIKFEVGKEIMDSLEEIGEAGPEKLEIDPNLEDLYFNIEAVLINKVGKEIGGQLHTGRSRNDLYATVLRLNSRKAVLEICHLLIELRYTLLTLAEKYKHVVMTAYTHMQPAEPITLGHYLSAMLYALDRDFSRFIAAFHRTNYSPLGAGATASTTFPINRKQTARLLGFINPMGNSLDGIASRDYLLEIVSAMNIFANNMSRLSQDLYIWSTDEFGLVEVDDSVAASSSIMPQKKNPITLEHIKAKSGHVLGGLVSMTSIMKNTPYGHSRDLAGESHKGFWEAASEIKAAAVLMNETLDTVSFKEEQMIKRAKNNFSTVTELANVLVREGGISFREAHQIVGQLVSEMIEANTPVTKVTSEVIRKISYQLLGKELVITEVSINKALDPAENAKAKNAEGGPAPTTVELQLEAMRNKLHKDRKWLEEQYKVIEERKEDLSNFIK
ncbi:argininosuccinate lyase [Oceanobacillus oncorhynchi subsp. incaldanensis]|uniref:argininosuccinate lyase n=1 Tax=Oceanobacillus oncorhynchi TaxID=545501 RepID=UPI001B096765|nr:argininosuccinate lyase [Oceanobacillus oncorhynchi]GIO19690.1 argininosuccinate lyase [Oceanobacillus oncorhynchi subsp. incaldanensis]